MPDALDKAIDKLRTLSPRQRSAAAAAIDDFMAAESEPSYELSDEERALVEHGLAELDRGEYVTQAEVDAALAKYLQR